LDAVALDAPCHGLRRNDETAEPSTAEPIEDPEPSHPDEGARMMLRPDERAPRDRRHRDDDRSECRPVEVDDQGAYRPEDSPKAPQAARSPAAAETEPTDDKAVCHARVRGVAS